MAINTNTRSNLVREHLLDLIDKNKLSQGDQLPSESEMAKTLGVSRSTIREAYITLEAEGIIVRKHGKGTFVSRSAKIREPLIGEIVGFPDRVNAAGHVSDFKVFSIGHVVPAAEISQQIQSNPGEEVLQVKFVHYADGDPTVYIVDFFATWIDESKFNWQEFDGHMVEFISISLAMPERHYHTRIVATLADEEVSTHLAIPMGTPIINVRSRVSTIDGRPVSYTVVYLNPEKIEFELDRVYRYQ